MRRGTLFLVLLVVAAAVGAGSARADGTGTTTTGATTTAATTTTTAAPSYGPLSSAYLPTTCVAAGDAAIATPAGQPLVLGTPAAAGGPSAYPTTSPAVAFGSSAVSGSTCTGTHVALASVSLFGGFVTASSVTAMNGRGTVSGLTIDGSPTSLSPGESALLGYWGQLTLGKTVGRMRAPLVVLLLKRYWNLPAGTMVLVGFAASALPVHTATTHRSSETAERTSTTPTAKSQHRSQHTLGKRKHPKRHAKRLPALPPPDFPSTPYPFTVTSDLAPAVQHNPVVSTAMQYLGIPYKWAGASPQAGFDCSGLVKYVFAQLGVTLPHFAAAQWFSPGAVPVPPHELKAGDLVFFTGSDGTRKSPGHVGIYVGDGYLIDAPHTGSFVRIDSLDERSFADMYVGARRIVGTPSAARHLLHVTKPEPSAAASPLSLTPSLQIEPLGYSLGVVAAGASPAQSGSRGYWQAGAGLGGVLLLLAGAATYRRRMRAPESSPRTDGDPGS